MSETWLCVTFAIAVTMAVLCWQKRAQFARWAAGWLLGYADSVDHRERAVERWRHMIKGDGMEQELKREVRSRG